MKYSKGEISRIILGVVAAAGALTVLATFPGLAVILPLFGLSNKKQGRAYYRTLRNLEGNKFISLRNKSGGKKLEIKLTAKGYKKLRSYEVASMQLPKPEKWDKKWRLVLFDIPENKRVARQRLQWKLRELGCFRMQKSAYIYPHECKTELEKISKYFNVQEYISYLVVIEVPNKNFLEAHFKLD